MGWAHGPGRFRCWGVGCRRRVGRWMGTCARGQPRWFHYSNRVWIVIIWDPGSHVLGCAGIAIRVCSHGDQVHVCLVIEIDVTSYHYVRPRGPCTRLRRDGRICMFPRWSSTCLPGHRNWCHQSNRVLISNTLNACGTQESMYFCCNWKYPM